MGVTVYSESSSRRSTSAQGLTVKSVEKDSPAEEAGVQEGDIITEVNGEKVTAYSDLSSVISKSKAGDVITLTINRDGETLKIKVTLGVHKQAALPEKDSSSNDQEYPGDQESGNGNGSNRRGQGSQNGGFPGFRGRSGSSDDEE